jgi:hypothetical protein
LSEIIRQKRYVAYFDMLGFKTATSRNPSVAWDALVSLRQSMDEVSRLMIEVKDDGVLLKDRVKIFILADSVLLFTAEDKAYDLIAILLLTSTLFAKCLNKCVLLRGAITHGEFFYNLHLNLFGGAPFVRAYELERKANWSGIVVDDSVAIQYQKRNIPATKNGDPIIIQWDVPLKQQTTERQWVLDWVTVHKSNFIMPIPVKVQDYYSPFTKLFGPYTELTEEIQEKYINTVDFINNRLQCEGKSSLTTE